jgi:uncharacterized membrane protein YkoI
VKKISLKLVLLSSLSLTSINALAADQNLENCIQAIKQQKSGDLIKLEKLDVAGKSTYELELRDNNHQEWEFMCDAESGKVTEKESEVSNPNTQAFKKNVKLTEEDAIAIAIKANPGTIQEVEYEIEENGASSYEFDIVNDNGVETKIEVDAANGKIIETATELWEMGEENDEKR